MIKRTWSFFFVAFILIFFCTNTWADDISDARTAAINILKKLERKQNKDVWENNVSEWFKEKMTRDAFLANLTMIQNQLGGQSTERKLIQQNKSDGDPQNGYKGKVFSFMFSTTFPVAKVYEAIVLIEDSGTYKIAGLNFVPNPN